MDKTIRVITHMVIFLSLLATAYDLSFVRCLP